MFGLHVGEDAPDDFEGWLERFHVPGSVIVSEDDDEISPEEMVKIIAKRESRRKEPFEKDWLVRNQAVQGPGGLARHRIDNKFCVGHGEGTFDYLKGWFS